MTNKEWLQNADTDRLSEFLGNITDCKECVMMHNAGKPCMEKSCYDVWKEWLNEEAYVW